MEIKNNIEKKILIDEPMKNHVSFKIGGTADFFLKAETIEDIKNAIEFAKNKNIEFFILGNGSNILVTDKGIRGLVIKIDLKDIRIEKKEAFVEVTIGSGYKLMALGIKLMNEKISGFEELSGIPGTIGGAVYMNAGAYGKEMKDVVISTKCMDYNGNIFELSNKEQKLGYRTSIFQEKKYVILETKLKLYYGEKKDIQEKLEQYKRQRLEKQPLEYPSAGSTFKRQEGIITAKLIDECGLKGYKIGGAKVSEKHAGFIVNNGAATAKDVMDLIKYIKDKVYEKHGVKIEEEIKIIGEI